MTTVEEQEIIDDLYSLNCCPSCIIRFLGRQHMSDCSDFEIIHEYIDDKFSHKTKMRRMSPCCACLNLLSFVGDVANEIKRKAMEVQSSSYYIEFQVPYRTLAINQRSLLIYLKEKYPNFTEDIKIPLPRSTLRFKVIEHLRLCSLIYQLDSNLLIQVKFDYYDEKKNIEIINRLVSQKSRSIDLEHQILEIEPEVFKKYFKVPIESPFHPVSLTSVVINPRPILIGGRYFKLDRNVLTYDRCNQTFFPRVVTVESIILAAFKHILRYADFEPTFHCCGADMCQSRVIGEGKPFCVQYKYKYWNSVSQDHLRQIAAIINQNSFLKVGKLKMIDTYELIALKEAEHEANRVYNLLCNTMAPDVNVAVEVINSVIKGTSLKINQSTPISALVTRKPMIREREIFEMEAKTVPGRPNLFELKLTVQAGTFISEFIHGDFERTTPNISSIIGYSTDAIAVDLISIKFTFLEDDDTKNENEDNLLFQTIKNEPIEVKAEIKTEH